MAEATGELTDEGLLASRHELLPTLRLLGPHDGRAVPCEREDSEGARGQKVLHRLAVVGALMRHGGDDADLRIGPADGLDAGALAKFRAPAVRRDQETPLQRRAAGKMGAHAKCVRLEVVDAVRCEHIDRLLRSDGRAGSTRAMRTPSGASLASARASVPPTKPPPATMAS